MSFGRSKEDQTYQEEIDQKNLWKNKEGIGLETGEGRLGAYVMEVKRKGPMYDA